VLVSGDTFAVVADRLSPSQMMANESVPEWLESDQAERAAAVTAGGAAAAPTI
jgi:hypothetical protein